MNKQLAPFRTLVHQLHNNPNVVLLDYQEFEGIDPTSAAVAEIEESIGFKIPSDILDFYAASNGLRLSWMHKQDGFYEEEDHIPYDLPNDLDQVSREAANMNDLASQHESGSINIRCLYNVFMSDFTMNEELREEGFYVFDSFSYIHGAAISFPKSKDQPIISFNGDHYTHFNDYENALSFSDYLKFLIQCKGVKTLRNHQQKINLLKEDLTTWSDEFYFSEY